MEALHELELLIRSRHPILVVDTYEEARLEDALRQVAGTLQLKFHVWSLTSGLKVDGADARFYDSTEPLKALENLPSLAKEGIWLFKDIHHHLTEPVLIRHLRDLGRLEPGQRRTIVLAGSRLEVPPDLEKVAVRFELAPPSDVELRRMVHRVVEDVARRQPIAVDLKDEDYRRLIEGLKGLTLFEAERAVMRALLEDSALTAEDVEGIEAAKRAVLHQEGAVEYLAKREDDADIGGLRSLKAWLDKRQKAFTPEAKAFGLPAPKGIVLLGVQGCGKTRAARMIAATWRLPLLKLEAGRLFDMYVGQSEKNLDRAIKAAEHMAPCVLLIDEIEKAFAAAGSANLDGGLSRRMLGRLLGWLQEREGAVFVVATCNDVNGLPPEMLRKGRFDEIFFVDLPNAMERSEILGLHLKKRDRDPAAFDLDALAKAGEGFSGAELEQAIVAALYTAFSAGGTLDHAALEAELRGTRPLSVLRREPIEALRAWARERAVPAN